MNSVSPLLNDMYNGVCMLRPCLRSEQNVGIESCKDCQALQMKIYMIFHSHLRYIFLDLQKQF